MINRFVVGRACGIPHTIVIRYVQFIPLTDELQYNFYVWSSVKNHLQVYGMEQQAILLLNVIMYKILPLPLLVDCFQS